MTERTVVVTRVVPPRRAPRWRGSAVVRMAALALAAVTLAGCGIGDAVNRQTDRVISSATCAVLTPVLDGVTSQVDAAVREIEADPAAAKAALEEARTAIAGATQSGGESVTGLLDPVLSALDGLIALAEKAESGAAINDADRSGAALAVDEALAGLVARCE